MVTNLDAFNYPIIKVPASLNTKDHASVQEPPSVGQTRALDVRQDPM
jgi:hypothetical protein